MTTEEFYAALTPDYDAIYKCDMCHEEYNVSMPFVDVPPLYNYFSKHYIVCWNCSTKIINGDKQAVEWFNKYIRRRSEKE